MWETLQNCRLCVTRSYANPFQSKKTDVKGGVGGGGWASTDTTTHFALQTRHIAGDVNEFRIILRRDVSPTPPLVVLQLAHERKMDDIAASWRYLTFIDREFLSPSEGEVLEARRSPPNGGVTSTSPSHCVGKNANRASGPTPLSPSAKVNTPLGTKLPTPLEGLAERVPSLRIDPRVARGNVFKWISRHAREVMEFVASVYENGISSDDAAGESGGAGEGEERLLTLPPHIPRTASESCAADASGDGREERVRGRFTRLLKRLKAPFSKSPPHATAGGVPPSPSFSGEADDSPLSGDEGATSWRPFSVMKRRPKTRAEWQRRTELEQEAKRNRTIAAMLFTAVYAWLLRWVVWDAFLLLLLIIEVGVFIVFTRYRSIAIYFARRTARNRVDGVKDWFYFGLIRRAKRSPEAPSVDADGVE